MQDARILSILYDMALVIGGTDRLPTLLNDTLHRLLYHTGFPAGLVLLHEPGQPPEALPRLALVVGDHGLAERIGEAFALPQALASSEPMLIQESSVIDELPLKRGKYRSLLSLPVPRGYGYLLLLGSEPQTEPLPWGEMFKPVLGNFARAVELCRLNESHTLALTRERDEAHLRLERFRAALDESADYILLLDPETLDVLDCNRRVRSEFGEPQTLIRRCESSGATGDAIDWRERFARLRAGDRDASRLEAVLRSEERRMPLDIRLSVLERTGDEFPIGILLARDISERKRSEEALFEEKERALVTLQSIGDAVITTDLEGRVEYLNPQAEALTRWPLDEARGLPLSVVFNIVNEYTRDTVENPVMHVLKTGVVVGLANHTVLIARDGSERAIEDSAAPIRDRHNAIIGVVMVFHDVTDTRELARQLSWQATHDSLTGLYNRHEFERRLQEALQSARQEQRNHMLLYLDLDQFKLVNDTSGHVAGDQLLKRLAERFSTEVRKTDVLARLGGDEFGLLLEDCPLPQAQRIAEELLQDIVEFRFVWEDRVFEVGASIGIAPIDAETESAASVMSAADIACYAAKDRGRSRVQVYEPTDVEIIRRRGEMHTVADLRHALDNGGLLIYIQPIQSLGHETRPYYEVLVRMRGVDGELLSPGAFIPAAERFGVMQDIDRWVIREALSTLQAAPPDVMFSINLSGTSLGEEGLLDYVRQELATYGIAAERICFEITETAAIANLDGARALIEALKADGCRFSLDDFGTGLSSFSYLKNLPVDYLKIDGSFVREMLNDPLDLAVVEAVNRIAHVLGKRTIAEFVEGLDVLQHLREIGVDYAQGYAVGRPVSCEALFA